MKYESLMSHHCSWSTEETNSWLMFVLLPPGTCTLFSLLPLPAFLGKFGLPSWPYRFVSALFTSFTLSPLPSWYKLLSPGWPQRLWTGFLLSILPLVHVLHWIKWAGPCHFRTLNLQWLPGSRFLIEACNIPSALYPLSFLALPTLPSHLSSLTSLPEWPVCFCLSGSSLVLTLKVQYPRKERGLVTLYHLPLLSEPYPICSLCS